MKIVFNSTSNELTNHFIRYALEFDKIEVIGAKPERSLFDEIKKENSDAFVLESGSNWTQKAVDFIKKRNPYTPVIILIKNHTTQEWPRGADIYISIYDIHFDDISESALRCIIAYNSKFEKLQKLTSKMKEEIEFGDFKYDPVRRNFRYKDKLVKKMSPKEGGVLEILAANFGNVVKKDIIMEKVWHNVDFYIGRSMDVYVTNLRNLFKKESLPISVKNIPNAGLILENE